MFKKCCCFFIMIVLFINLCFSQTQSFEFINQNITDVLFIFSNQLKKAILPDGTLSGSTSFQFSGTDTQKAFESFLSANRLFAYEEDGVIYVSKINITKNEDGTINIESYDSTSAEIIEKIGQFTKTTITYEMLPSVRNSICAENVSVPEALEILLRPYSEYEIVPEEKYIFVKRKNAQNPYSNITEAGSVLELNQDQQEDEQSAPTYTAEIKRASLKEAIEKLFSLTDKDYTSFITNDVLVESVKFSGKSFEESLALILEGGSARSKEMKGIWYIFQEENQKVQDKIKKQQEYWSLVTLKHSTFSEIRGILEEKYSYLKFYELPNKNVFAISASEKDSEEIKEFVKLIDIPKESKVIKLKYIKAEDLISHLPPSVKAEDVVLTGNNSSVFFKGTEENKKIFLKELETIDLPSKRIRYDMLIVQYQQSANLQWSLSFEADSLVPGHKTLLTGTLGNLLNLNFDVVTVFGYLFALKFNTALAENKASVFADTTLHGVSGENIQFRNTSTYRYRDSTIDPETGEPKYTGVTREIVSGLVLDINGWISGDGMITTTVTASVSKQGVDVSATTGNPPPTSEKIITTQVRSKSGEPVILSGLTQNDTSISDEGLPFLKKIPILNKLFSTYLKTDEQSEMVIYLVPHLEKDSIETNEVLDLENVYKKYGKRHWKRKGYAS